MRCNCINILLPLLLLGTWAYTTDDLAFKADVETSILAESKENFSSSAGWNVLEYRGLQHYPNNTALQKRRKHDNYSNLGISVQLQD